MEKTIADKTVTVNEEGFMTDAAQWCKEIGEALALEEGICMVDRHWVVVDYLRDQDAQGVPMSIRKIKNSGVVDIKEIYQLFPKGPLKVASKVAGLKKPASCL